MIGVGVGTSRKRDHSRHLFSSSPHKSGLPDPRSRAKMRRPGYPGGSIGDRGALRLLALRQGGIVLANTVLANKADSYVCGIADAPLLGDTIGRSLDNAARRWGNREALVSPSHGVRWTWKELAERVDALAAGFLALGLERGERIGVWSLNRPEWTLTQFAAAKAGLDPGHHQSRLSAERTRIRACTRSAARRSSRPPRSRPRTTSEMLNTLMPELARAEAGRSARGAAAAIARGDPDRRAALSGHDPVRRGCAHGRRRGIATRSRRSAKPFSSTIPSTSSSPAAPPARPRASR